MGYVVTPYTEFIRKLKKFFGMCNHNYIIRYDERYDMGDEKHHTFKVTLCENCGKVKSMEMMQ